MRDLPSGTVTFLFTDIEGSTKLLQELGPEGYAKALSAHRRVLRAAFASHGGVEVDTQGDAFFVAYGDARAAVAAAATAQQALSDGPIRVRMGLHTGTPHLTAEGYVGEDVHLGARIAASGHGGQVLISKATRETFDGDSEVSDLGEHRLKDFAAPVWIYQLGADRFPPLKTISNTNLPRPASSFVGRETEVAQIGALLRNGARLVTLTGPGGTGKTRLAIEAAAELVPEFKNGVFWIGLAALRDPTLVSDTIGQTLGAKDDLGQHIGVREMLLVLDNLEQIVEAAPGLAGLVEACPNLRLLVTSRERLRVTGEVEYAVPPLAEREAIELFTARSHLAPDDTITELCRRLDDLPLAVELAAARTSVLSPTQILERLSTRLDLLKGGRDADARQRTLRATIEWSHDLLSGEERALFARLSVFAGGCALEAAEAVVGADLDVLQSLVDKSLVRHADERFAMLETVREFATERLEGSGQATDLGRRHAQYFLALAEEAEPHVRGQDPTAWLERLDRERDNLRAALDWLEQSASIEQALRLSGAVDEFWCARRHVPEGKRYLERLLGMDERPTAARAKALAAAAHMARDIGDTAIGRRWASEASAINTQLGSAWGAANAVLWLGLIDADEGHFATAQRRFHESATRFGAVGDQYLATYATRLLAWTHDALGDRAHARALHEANLSRTRELGARDLEASTLGALASYAADENRLFDAARLAAESVRIYRELGSESGVAVELCRCAAALALAGEAHLATRLLASAAMSFEEAGTKMPPFLVTENGPTLKLIHEQLDEEAFSGAWDQGRRLTIQTAAGLALEALGAIADPAPGQP